MREKAEALSRDTIEYLEAVSSLAGCAFNTCLVSYEPFSLSQIFLLQFC